MMDVIELMVDMVDMDMVDMDIVDMDIVDMDIVDMDMDRKIKSSLKIGLVVLQNILSYYVFKLSATSTRSLPGCCPFWQVMSASNARSLSWTR